MMSKATRLWIPEIKPAIPADVCADANAVRLAMAHLSRANAMLVGRTCESKEEAVEEAAVALTNSGSGACGIPSAIRRHKTA